MGGRISNTISMSQSAEFARSGRSTEVADWVILLDLAPESHVLYMRMGRMAAHEDLKGVRVTIDKAEADRLCGGDGVAALQELLQVGAITRVAVYKSGKARFQIEVYPPEVRTLMSGYRHEGGLPLVSFG